MSGSLSLLSRTMTPPPNDTGIDDRHELFFFESSAHDQTIASWLAQYTYVTNNLSAAADNVRSPPSELISTFFLGYVRESLGMTIPIIWMANLACNFSSEFTDSDFFKNQEKISTIPPMYRQFTMEEQKRFDALQLTYLTQKIEHSVDLEYCGTKQFNLSPRMIISSKAERSKMIEVLIRYLDVKAKGEKREKMEFSNDEDKNFVKRGMGKKKTKKMNRRRYLRRQQQAKEQELSLMILSFDNDSRNDLSVKEQNDNDDENDNNEFQVSNEEWCCDYCGVAMFPTYEDACQHENVCCVYLKLKEKEDTATVDDNEAKNMYLIKEEIAEESTSAPIATQSTLKDEAVAQQEKVSCESLTNVMRSAMIDYDDRVNDTALPLPNQDSEELSIPLDKIYKLSSSPIQPILLYNVHAAKTSDEVGLLQRVTNLTRENELLIDHTNLLIKQNNTLTEKLVETKRQSIEAVQQVHLKAYIAETARAAADERASQLVGMLTDYFTYKVTDEVMREEMLGALARVTVPSSPSISHTQMWHVQHADAQALRIDSTTSNNILTPSSPGSILNRLRRGDHASCE